MTRNNLHNISTAALRAELDQIVSDTAEWMQRAALILVEMRRRRESHPLMQSNTLRHFKMIAEGKLDPAAALAVGGNRNLVKALARLPKADQLDYATKRTVQVVEHRSDGEEVIEDRHITHLSPKTLDRVFGENGLRSITEQKEILGTPPNRTRVNGFLIDHTEHAIVIARKNIHPNDLIQPLKALGFKLTKIEGETLSADLQGKSPAGQRAPSDEGTLT